MIHFHIIVLTFRNVLLSVVENSQPMEASNIVINVAPENPEEYLQELRAGLFQLLKQPFRCATVDLQEEEVTGYYYVLDLLEKLTLPEKAVTKED